MRLLPSDPDIQTIVARINSNDINLQPDFQRGEVWSDAKKRRLIDSILRNWHVPPIHVVEVIETGVQEVLDGQQRLVAIRDFVNGSIKVDGKIEPIQQELVDLHNLRYAELPAFWKRRFDQFTIRLFRITDYLPEEPGELFYRLNQPTKLTSAEQRNAFFGPVRQQVKNLAESFDENGLTPEFLGFSNSRMSYEDLIAKLCYTLESKTMLEKVSATNVTDKYRSRREYSYETMLRAENAIKLLGESRYWIDKNVRFNKATLFSWLCFIAEIQDPIAVDYTPELIGEFINHFETKRMEAKASRLEIFYNVVENDLLNIFTDRASSRVANVLSVLTRDLVIWILFALFVRQKGISLNYQNPRVRILENYKHVLRHKVGEIDRQDILFEIIEKEKWGKTV